ncbi:peptidase S1 [Brevundimonas sp.]
MRIILALGALAIIGLSGCAEDPYGYGGGYGVGPAYGGGSYGGYGAPDPSARANYGEEYLGAGFDDDPRTVSIVSGGELNASSLGDDCVGMISRAPDFQLTYDAGDLPLTFGVSSYTDATLVINGPDGDWYCDDDSGGGTDPEITFYRPRSGVYDVWVGAFDGDGGEGELFITELR